MKKLSIHRVHNVVAIAIVGVLFGAAYFANPTAFKASEVRADASANVSGWAWSLGTGTTPTGDNPAGPYSDVAGSNPGIGWISFNSFDCDTDKNAFTDSGACGGDNSSTIAQDYGVNISSLTGIGNFSGQAWAPNDPDSNGNPTGIGWISFDRAVTGTPLLAWGDPGLSQSSTPLAYVNWADGKVYGWARALVACKDTNWDGAKCTSSSAGDKAGGWDGWIKLSGTATDGSPYGVAIATDGTFSGEAWGGDIVGWVDFAPASAVNNKVHLPMPCTQSNPNFFWGICPVSAQCTGNPSPRDVDVFQNGACSDGSIPAAPITQQCGTISQVTCIATEGNPVCGDSACNYGETSSSCLADCKPETRFWQF